VENTELMVIANLSNELRPWVDTSKVAIEIYFANIRAQLVAYPVLPPSPLTDGPFTTSPWSAKPSPGTYNTLNP